MEEELKQIEEEVKNCNKCKLCQNRNKTVFGQGNPNARIMFVGEGPGGDEDLQGLPFVGKAGKLMNQAFLGLGIKRENVYISNIVKCRPPKNRTPEKDEIDACVGYLKKQIMLVKPEIIVLLGNTALKSVFGNEYNITSSRGKWMEKKNIRYMPTFHPAALLRDENKKIEFWEDLKKVINA